MERVVLLMTAAWDTIEVVHQAICSARAELWSSIKSDELIDSTKALLRLVTGIDKMVKHCNAFLGVRAEALNFAKQAELVQLFCASKILQN